MTAKADGQEAHKQLLLLLEQAANQHGEVSPDTMASLQSLALANLGSKDLACI